MKTVFLTTHTFFFLLYLSYMLLKKDIMWGDFTVGMGFSAALFGIMYNLEKRA